MSADLGFHQESYYHKPHRKTADKPARQRRRRNRQKQASKNIQSVVSPNSTSTVSRNILEEYSDIVNFSPDDHYAKTSSEVHDSQILSNEEPLCEEPLVWLNVEPDVIATNVDNEFLLTRLPSPAANEFIEPLSEETMNDDIPSSVMHDKAVLSQILTQNDMNTNKSDWTNPQLTSSARPSLSTSSPLPDRISSSNPSPAELMMLHSLVKELYLRTCPTENDDQFAGHGRSQDPGVCSRPVVGRPYY